MSDIDHSRMIPLHIADQAVAACEKEIAALKAEVERLQKLVGMQKSIDESIDAWIESKRDAAKEGKPSV